MSEKELRYEHVSYLGQNKCQSQCRMKRDDRDLKWRAGATGAWPEPLKDGSSAVEYGGRQSYWEEAKTSLRLFTARDQILYTKPFQSSREDEIWSTFLSTQVTFQSLNEATGTTWILGSMGNCFAGVSTQRKAKTKQYRERKLSFPEHPLCERGRGWQVLCLIPWML